MDNRPIGVFDSGLGGLTAVSALRKLMPGENIIYFADTARCPYGTRSRDQLRSFASDNLELLASFGVKAILAACGTLSANAGDLLAGFRLPVVNVLDPAVRELCRTEGNAPLSVIATDASIQSGVFQRKIRELCPEREIVAVPCQDFVALCEKGKIHPEDEDLKKTVEKYLKPVKDSGAAAMILGCTHFGLISEAISDYLGKEIQLLSASDCAAQEMQNLLSERGLRSDNTAGNVEYHTSGEVQVFERLAGQILNIEVKAVRTSAQ